MKKQQSGFTLIELIMVIVILGVLAAVAVPQFINLGRDARIATLNGALGSVRSAAAIVHSAALARPAQNPIVVDGGTVTIVSAYPTADAAGIVAAAQLATDYTLTGGGAAAGSVATISVTGGTDAPTCSFTYTSPAAGAAPAISAANTAGC